MTRASRPSAGPEGAYGRTGRRAETAYLDRTARWAARFEAARAAAR
jgi:glycoprotein endo-alpha-1,2-mannosidase